MVIDGLEIRRELWWKVAGGQKGAVVIVSRDVKREISIVQKQTALSRTEWNRFRDKGT